MYYYWNYTGIVQCIVYTIHYSVLYSTLQREVDYAKSHILAPNIAATKRLLKEKTISLTTILVEFCTLAAHYSI